MVAVAESINNRFDPCYESVTPRQLLSITPGKETILGSGDSFERDKILEGFLPGGLLVYTHDARMYPVKTDLQKQRTVITRDDGDHVVFGHEQNTGEIIFNKPEVRDIAGVAAIAASSYGEYHVVVMHTGSVDEPVPTSIVDIPDHESQVFLNIQAHIAEQWLGQYGEINWGVNMGAANFPHLRDGKEQRIHGNASVLRPHSHVFVGQESVRGIGIEERKNVRRHAVWDQGISLHLGKRILADAQNGFLQQFHDVKVEADKMGGTIEFPDLSPKEFLNIRFVDTFLRPLALTVHERLREWQQGMYGTELNDVIKCIQEGHTNGGVDVEGFNEFFSQLQLQVDPEITQQAREYHEQGELREPAAYAIGVHFKKDPETQKTKALVTFLLSICNWPGGPAESLAVHLTRDTKLLPPEEMAARLSHYQQVVFSQGQLAA